MANYFPMGYQPSYYPQQNQYLQQLQNQPQQQQQTSSGIIWVQGEAGAKSYLVAPNTTVQLWDSENQVIYLKSADASGMPSMRIIDYTVRDSQQQTIPKQVPEYVTHSDLDAFKNEINTKLAEYMKTQEAKDAESLV